MKKAVLSLLMIALCVSLCACGGMSASVFVEEDGNDQLVSLENKKISADDIEFSVVSVESESENRVKTYKLDYTKDDFSIKFEKIKTSGGVYPEEKDRAPIYPEKTQLPEYDLPALREIALSAYLLKYGQPFPENGFLSEPEFSVRSFTGKLVVTYKAFTDPSDDGAGGTVYNAAKRIRMTGDLYTYTVE